MTVNQVDAALALPAGETAAALLALPEDQWFDRKSVRMLPKDLGPSLTAFANAEGGIIVIGLHDGQVEGLRGYPEKINSFRQAAIDFTVPPVRMSVSEVACVNSRGEEFSAAAGSVPAKVRIKTGVKKDGTITARAMEFTWDTGAYAEGLAGSNRALKDGVGPYKIPNIRVSSTLVYTNKLRGCPFRGLGIPEAVWAGESQMDMISQKLGIDPVELRLKNCLTTGDETPAGDRATREGWFAR